MSKDLGPKPDARIEPGEPNPGGVDAVDAALLQRAPVGGPTIPNLPTDKNPAVGDDAPDEVKQGEDTSTRATRSDGEEGDDEEPEEAPV